MLWQLLKGAGGRYVPGTGEYSGADRTETETTEIGDLDPIDPEIAGKANIPAMKAGMKSYAFAIRALLIISSLTHFIAEVSPHAPEIRRVPTSEKWWTRPNHLKQLIDSKMIEFLPEALVCGCSSYFAIGKSDGTARSIWNGKNFSLRCATPAPTNLPDVIRVLILLEEMMQELQQPTILEGDVRHYFHQLGLEDDITRYLCVYMDGKFWRWKNLPMGLSWSPFVAQCIGMGSILRTLEDCGYDTSAYKDLKTPPSIIVLRAKDGKIEVLAALWYDNILIAVRDPNRAPKVYSRFRYNSEEVFHLILKAWNIHGPKAMRNGYITIVPETATSKRAIKVDYPSYLGLELNMRRSMTLGVSAYQLHWKISSSRLKDWAILVEKLRLQMSCRTVSRTVGAIMYRHHIALTPLCRLEKVIDLIRKSGSLCRTRTSWDEIRNWSADELEILKSALSVATTEGAWFTVPIRPTQSEIFVATDSSGKRWGSCVWTADRQLHPTMGYEKGVWNRSMMQADIFVKELTAAVLCVEKVARLYPGTKIYVFGDNTAAIAVMKKLASTTHIGNELARRLDNVLSETGCTMEVIHITTTMNPADDPSRNKPFVQAKADFMFKLLDAYKGGYHVDPPESVKRPKPTESGLRHPETEFVEVRVPNDDDEDDETSEIDPEETCLSVTDWDLLDEDDY